MFCERDLYYGSSLILRDENILLNLEMNLTLMNLRCGIVLINVTEVIDDIKIFPWFANYPGLPGPFIT